MEAVLLDLTIIFLTDLSSACQFWGGGENKLERSGLKLCVHLDFIRILGCALGNEDPASLVSYHYETGLSSG